MKLVFQSENKGKNRCPDVLPYDHSRVVLNALANANSSDYINASTIVNVFVYQLNAFSYVHWQCYRLITTRVTQLTSQLRPRWPIQHLISGK